MKPSIKGVIIRRLKSHADERGWLVELFRQDKLSQSNLPAMAYISSTKPGASRGPHEHKKQSDLFCFLPGPIFAVYLWDNRKKSKTFGKSEKFQCDNDESTLVIIPPGVVHAYKNIGKTEGLVFNAPNRLYKGKNRTEPTDEIRHEEKPDCPFKLDD